MGSRLQAIALTPSTAGFLDIGFDDLDDESDDHFATYKRIATRTWDDALNLFQSNIGLLFIIFSQLNGTCQNVIAKILNSVDPPVPTFEIIFIRMSMTYVCSTGYMYYASVPYPLTGPPEVRRLLAFRGVSGFFGLFGIYYSLEYLSLSDATVLTFLLPTTTAIAGYLLLGETLSRREIIAGLFSFTGVVLIARPQFLFGHDSAPIGPVEGVDVLPAEKGTPTQRLIAVGVALIGVLGGTGALISLRAIGKRASPMHSISYFSLWSCIVATLGTILLRIPIVLPTNFLFGVYMLGLGGFGFFTQLFLTIGLQRETASRGALGIYVQIIFAAVAERWIFHTTTSYLSIFGTIIILVCAVYVALVKNSKPEAKASNSSTVAIDLEEIEGNSDSGDEHTGLVLGTKQNRLPDLERDINGRVSTDK